MTNYIVNKTTTEVFGVVADSFNEATKAVEQENGVAMGFNVAYNVRPQPQPQPQAPPIAPVK
jgi:hypothetical protein